MKSTIKKISRPFMLLVVDKVNFYKMICRCTQITVIFSGYYCKTRALNFDYCKDASFIYFTAHHYGREFVFIHQTLHRCENDIMLTPILKRKNVIMADLAPIQ